MATDDGSPTDDDWRRFGQTIERRRLERGFSQEQLVKRGGPSHQTVRNIERGLAADYRPTTFRNLDRALDWPHGTAEKILRGSATDEEVAAVEVWPGLAERIDAAYTPPLGAGLRDLAGQPSAADAVARVVSTVSALIAEDQERLRALLDEGREDDPETKKVIARMVEYAEQLNRLTGGRSN